MAIKNGDIMEQSDEEKEEDEENVKQLNHCEEKKESMFP